MGPPGRGSLGWDGTVPSFGASIRIPALRAVAPTIHPPPGARGRPRASEHRSLLPDVDAIGRRGPGCGPHYHRLERLNPATTSRPWRSRRAPMVKPGVGSPGRHGAREMVAQASSTPATRSPHDRRRRSRSCGPRGACVRRRRDRARRLLGARVALGEAGGRVPRARPGRARGRQADHRPHPQARAPHARDPGGARRDARRLALLRKQGDARAPESPSAATTSRSRRTRGVRRASPACSRPCRATGSCLETDCAILSPNRTERTSRRPSRARLPTPSELWAYRSTT